MLLIFYFYCSHLQCPTILKFQFEFVMPGFNDWMLWVFKFLCGQDFVILPWGNWTISRRFYSSILDSRSSASGSWLSQYFLAPPSGRPRNRHLGVHLAPTSSLGIVSLPLSIHAEQLRLFHVTAPHPQPRCRNLNKISRRLSPGQMITVTIMVNS